MLTELGVELDELLPNLVLVQLRAREVVGLPDDDDQPRLEQREDEKERERRHDEVRKELLYY